MDLLHLRRIDRERNMSRFYNLSIEPTLFGTASVVREWGRIGSKGRRRIDLCEDAAEARDAYDDLLRVRLRRGYIQQ